MNPAVKREDKAGEAHWNDTWAIEPRMRLPLACTSSIRDKMSLLGSVVQPGMKFLEIGCAPGKMLSWVAAVLGAQVSGLDYSEPGVRVAKRLFRELALPADIRHEDVFSTTFPENSFDVVYSAGVIEHFEDPTSIVRIHVKLLKPGGLALITVPNLRGLYGRLASKETLDIHNLDIMTPEALRDVVPRDLAGSVEAFRHGRFTLAMGAIDARWGIFSRILQVGSDLAGLAQPFRVEGLCPTIVLKIRRIEEQPCALFTL
jgi:2-polyprenyl-3-methyl-5-hydroxy-6-metoxy-1,4-benzoquinol methylase